MKYKTYRIVDNKPRLVIVDENGNVINRNPSNDELKGLRTFPKEKYKRNPRKDYTDKQLLSYLRQFYEKYGRPPSANDFNKSTYQRRFGSWTNALKMVGLDVESIIKKGILITTSQKARLAEIIVRGHFKKNPVDLAGENCISHCDGICPNGKNYDVKSSKFDLYTKRYRFSTKNKYKDEIEIYYFLAFNEDYTELIYVWRVPGEVIEKDYFQVVLNSYSREFTVEDMKEYDITDKIKGLL